MLKWILSLAMSVLLGWTTCYGKEELVFSEFQIKASFLLKFIKFVAYPDEGGSNGEINICVLGDDPFQGFLDTLTSSAQVRDTQGPLLRNHYIRTLNTGQKCHIIFVSKSEQRQMKNILNQLQRKPILTVSDLPNFTSSGGMIELYVSNNRVGFIIDPTIAKEAGLVISSRLLQIAKIKESPLK